MRQRRALYANDRAEVINILRDGTARANAVAQETLAKVKAAMKQEYFQ
jgi:tryptophanyl-tRNA synthetase